MLSCTEKGMYVEVGGFMFWEILPSISLYVWLLYIYKFVVYICIYIYIYIQQIYFMRDSFLRDTSSIIGPDYTGS